MRVDQTHCGVKGATGTSSKERTLTRRRRRSRDEAAFYNGGLGTAGGVEAQIKESRD
jgi:hypothetical protein